MRGSSRPGRRPVDSRATGSAPDARTCVRWARLLPVGPSPPTVNVAAMDAQPPNFRPFAHLTAPNAVLYRRVMLEFVVAKRRFIVHLRAEDVYGALASAGAPGP